MNSFNEEQSSYEEKSTGTTLLSDPETGEQYTPSGKFLFNNQKCLLTYPTHLDKDKYKSWLKTICNGYKQIEMAHETGDSNGIPYEHSHVLVDFGRQFKTTNARRFDYDGQHPNIKKVKNGVHWLNCCFYLGKQDPANTHLE